MSFAGIYSIKTEIIMIAIAIPNAAPTRPATDVNAFFIDFKLLGFIDTTFYHLSKRFAVSAIQSISN
jgi:hypothetical protein